MSMKKKSIRDERASKDALIDIILQDEDVLVKSDGTVWAKRQRVTAGREVDADGFVESIIRNGTRCVFFYEGSMISVPRLVYRKFHGPLDPDKEIVHINGDSSDNSKDNLEQRSESAGAGYSLRRFGADQILDMRERRASGEKLDSIAEDYDTSAIVVSKIVRGETYQDVGGPRTFSGDLETPRGPNNAKSVLDAEQYEQLLRDRASGDSLTILAERYPLTVSGISRICTKEKERIEQYRKEAVTPA